MADLLFTSDNHFTTLASVLQSYLSNEKLADVTLVAEGKTIQVHNIVLRALSTYFEVKYLSLSHVF